MRLACVLLLVWRLEAAEWLPGVQKQGAALEAERNWEEASAVYRSALTRLDSTSVPQDRLWLLTSLAEVAFERHNYEEARKWLHDAEDALHGVGPDAPERVRVLNASGTLHLVEGNLTAAERDLSRAVITSELAASKLDMAAALHNLAAVEMQTRRLGEATTHEARAIAIWQHELGENHYYVVKALISLSSLQGLCGHWQAAEISLRNSLAITETPEALANYAVVLGKLKRAREAREMRRRVHAFAAASPQLVDVKAIVHEHEKMGVRAQ